MAQSIIQPTANDTQSQYVKLPEGVLIQWGKDTVANGQTKKTVQFPYAFNGNYLYGVAVFGTYVNTRDLGWAYGGEKTTSIDFYRGTSTVNYNQPFRWIAVGRWK